MRWTSLHKIAISLPLAVLAALSLVAINEAGFHRSHAALEHLAHSQSTHASVNRLLQSMLDAETGHRGYLLTGDDRYLEPYEGAVTTVHSNLEQLRSIIKSLALTAESGELDAPEVNKVLAQFRHDKPAEETGFDFTEYFNFRRDGLADTVINGHSFATLVARRFKRYRPGQARRAARPDPARAAPASCLSSACWRWAA